ncbi:transmembrane protein 232 [Aplochiton taeniatus]
MPIINVPVVHNFGIISQAHKEHLQKRLLKKAEEIRATKQVSANRNPFEITEQFILKYNHSHGTDEHMNYIDLAKQLLNHSKRRAGLTCMGEGDHVDLPLAWTELLLLGLCNGKIQNDSLDCLLMSLDHAPMQAEQIPALFYLAETALYWVCTDTSQKPNLYTCEVKMIKLGYLAFLRLFLFHISGNLSGCQRSKSHLHNFLTALSQCESCYQPYPNILFAVQFILRTGEIISGLGPLQHESGPQAVRASSRAYSVNQVLWHCLLSWYCVQNSVCQLAQLEQHLVLLKHQMFKDNWLDCALGLMILGEAAKSSLMCLRMLMNLHSDMGQESNSQQTEVSFGLDGPSVKTSWPWQLEHTYTRVLADICLHSSNAEIQKAALVGFNTQKGQQKTDGLSTLLHCAGKKDWRLRYSVVQALVGVWRGLGGAVPQDGLKNSAWMALEEHLRLEIDRRVRDATTVMEAELNVGENSLLLCSGGKRSSDVTANPAAPSGIPDQLITWRLACMLSSLYLPPMPLPLSTSYTKLRKEYPAPSTTSKVPPQRKAMRSANKTEQPPSTSGHERKTSSRQSQKHGGHMDFNTRTEVDLMKVVEDQWQKELHIRLAEEEEVEKEEYEKKQKEEEESFKRIMRQRMEKVKKCTKPYELPRCYEVEKNGRSKRDEKPALRLARSPVWTAFFWAEEQRRGCAERPSELSGSKPG